MQKFPSPVIAALLGALALGGLAALPRLVPSAGMVGKPAPDFTVAVAANGRAGTQLHLADLKGQLVLLDFWASWCGPCALEAPVVDRVARRFADKGLVTLGVNVDDPPEVIRAYAQQKGLGYQMVVDAQKRASAAYGVDKLPSLVLIDRLGNVQALMTGFVDESALNDVVRAAL